MRLGKRAEDHSATLVKKRTLAIVPLADLLTSRLQCGQCLQGDPTLLTQSGTGPPCARQVEQRTPRQGQFATGMVWLFARQAQHGQSQRLQYRPDPQQRPPRTMHVRIRVFRIRLAYRKVRIDAAFLIFNRLAVFGTYAFKSCPPMGDSRLRDHHHTATAQADAPAQVRGFGERAEPWIDTLPSTQGGQWNQRAGKRHSQHILPAIILFLIRLTVHHQRRDIVVPRIQPDVMQAFRLPIQLFRAKQRRSRRVFPSIEQHLKA